MDTRARAALALAKHAIQKAFGVGNYLAMRSMHRSSGGGGGRGRYDESKHERDEDGKFAPKSGGGGASGGAGDRKPIDKITAGHRGPVDMFLWKGEYYESTHMTGTAPNGEQWWSYRNRKFPGERILVSRSGNVYNDTPSGMFGKAMGAADDMLKAYDESKHKRHPKGSPGGGKFAPAGGGSGLAGGGPPNAKDDAAMSAWWKQSKETHDKLSGKTPAKDDGRLLRGEQDKESKAIREKRIAEGRYNSPTGLPTPKAGGGSLVYDIESEGESYTVKVSRKPDGSFYGDAGEFDFTAANAVELHSKLIKWKAKHVGSEHD